MPNPEMGHVTGAGGADLRAASDTKRIFNVPSRRHSPFGYFPLRPEWAMAVDFSDVETALLWPGVCSPQNFRMFQ
jgi:hypothetical protein